MPSLALVTKQTALGAEKYCAPSPSMGSRSDGLASWVIVVFDNLTKSRATHGDEDDEDDGHDEEDECLCSRLPYQTERLSLLPAPTPDLSHLAMLALRTLAFVALAGWSLAAPLVEVDGASDTNMLVARQRTDWGGEPLVYKPYAEAAQSLGTPCDYQITFRRDTFDDRYYQRYYARYPGSSELRQLNPTTFARRNVGEVYGSYAVDKTHQLQIAQVRGACSAGSTGSTPTFFVRHTLGSGFTYSNDYISPGFTPSTRQLPAVPTNLQLTRVPNTQNYTVSWTRSATATGGYYVLITTRVYEYETGNHTPITTTVKLNATTSSYNFRITGRNYLDFVKVNLESFTDVVGDITKVPRVP